VKWARDGYSWQSFCSCRASHTRSRIIAPSFRRRANAITAWPCHQWVGEFFKLLDRHHSIRAANYFHRGASYKITRDTGEETLRAYREHIQNPRYLSRSVSQ
jgi:hypothetical protein